MNIKSILLFAIMAGRMDGQMFTSVVLTAYLEAILHTICPNPTNIKKYEK